MLSSIDLKSGEPNWTSFQNRAIDDAFRIRDFLGGDERSAAFTARPLGDPDTSAVIRVYPASDDSAAERQIGLWLRAKELEHPNLVRILGAGRIAAGSDGLIYVALEPADEKLASVLTERRLEPDEAAEILKNVASALRQLHDKGFVHGAVSPEQIFAIGDAIKLSAENIRVAGSHEQLFSDAPKFLAPESEGVNATAAADIWCLGATLYQCLTQESPDGTEFHHTTLPEPHRAIVRRALDPDPDARGTLDEIMEMERGKRAAAAAAAAANPTPAPEARVTPQPSTTPPAPIAPAAAPKPVSPPAVIRPGSESFPPAARRGQKTKSRERMPLWAYGAGVVVIILGLIFLLRPKHSPQKTAPPPSTVPAAQQKVIPPSSEPAGRMGSRSAAAPAGSTNDAVWRVIVYTYKTRDDAQRQVNAINQKHPNLKAEVFSVSGNSAPYLVVVGGAMNRDQAKRFRQIAVSSGMPRDAYLQNFTH